MKDENCKIDKELFIDYIDKFWHAEQSFDTTRQSNKEHEKEAHDFCKFLVKYCHCLPLERVNFHNLFHLDFVFFEKKIAFNFHSMANSPPKEEEPTPH